MKQIQVELLQHMGSDQMVGYAARTSSLSKTSREKKMDDVESLIKDRLIDWDDEEAHQTPFESVVMTFWYRMPVMIDRQHMTHRFASHNGMSGRYRTMPREYYALPDDVKDILKSVATTDISFFLNEAMDDYNRICTEANDFYEHCINAFKHLESTGKINNEQYKRLREVYRGVLPQSNMVERVSTFNLISFANYQRLRHTAKAQAEIMFIADEMLRLVKEANIAPVSIKCFEDLKWKVGNLIV